MKKYFKKNAKHDLPTRKSTDNKTTGGKALVVAGSAGFYGAAVLTCTAASRCGAGYTYLLTIGKFPVARHPDFLLFTPRQNLSDFSAIAVGPGFRSPKKIKSLLNKLETQKYRHVILDAEALSIVANRKHKLPSTWLITPHEGELSRILNISSEKIRRDRKKYVLLAQKKLGCVVLLKGYRTLIADGQGLWEIQSGNPALAKAGTGDVLTGMILAFMSQGKDTLTAAKLGSYIHGTIANHWLKSGNDVLSLMASDIVAQLPAAIRKIRKKS
jgi:ADP-dependent NAD(P)H-hydrate dehydratase